MLRAQGFRILIKPDPVKDQVKVSEELKKSGFVIGRTADEERRAEVATQIGTVVDVGPTAFHAYDKNSPDWRPWCKVGDRVIFARYSGKLVEDPVTEEKFMMVNDEDIQCTVEGELAPWET
jgi:co-chaperonin GroES (HSP10)